MRARLLFALAAVLLAPAGRPASARERGVSTPLSDRLARRVASAGVKAGKLGLCVVSLETGAVVAEAGSATPLVPASVAKVVTAAAALDLLGPGWTYETSVDAYGTFDGATGRLEGDLVVHGSGDPNLSRRGHEGDPMWPLSTLAQGVAARGVRSVSGALVLDDAPFDRVFVHPSWSADDLSRWYGAPVGGLSFNDSCVSVTVRGAAEPGEPARLEFPSSSGPWPVVNASVTSAAGRPDVDGVWIDGRTRLRVEGSEPARVPYTFEKPVPDPLAWFGSAFLEALRRAGVAVAGGVAAAAAPPAQVEPCGGSRLAVVSSGLPATLRVMNKKSQNFYASLVFKACGAAREGVGSWEAGGRAVVASLARRGIADPGLRLVDGSGLSDDNRLTASALARLLASFDGDVLRGPVLRDSLAVPGEDGTLHKRLTDPKQRDAALRARVHAKTGTLKGVHSLVGYVDGREGARGYAFAVLLNASPADGDPKGLIDDLVRELLVE